MKNRRQIRIVIADDHAILRSGLKMLLSAQPDMRVVGEADNGDQALEEVRLRKPDILVLDLSMSGTGGMEVIRQVPRSSPKTRVVVLTMHTEPAYLRSALEAGALGYVSKRALDYDLINAIRLTERGETFVDSRMGESLVRKPRTGNPMHALTPEHRCELLSRRELQVLKLAAGGFTNRQIASQIFISEKSVETYRARLLRKLKLHNRAEMVQFAVQAGLLSP